MEKVTLLRLIKVGRNRMEKATFALALVFLSACSGQSNDGSAPDSSVTDPKEIKTTGGKNCKYMNSVFSRWNWEFSVRLEHAKRIKRVGEGDLTPKQAWSETVDGFYKNMENARVEFLKVLDPDKKMFFIDEASYLAQNLGSYFEGLLSKSENNCSKWIDPMKKVIVEAEERQLENVKEILRNYALDMTVKRDHGKTGWASNLEDQKDRIRSNTHFRIVQELSSRGEENLQKIKDEILSTYEGTLKEAKEMGEVRLLEMVQFSYGQGLDGYNIFQIKDSEFILTEKITGIGAQLGMLNEEVLIQELIPGGPAKKSGKFQSTDVILAVGQGEDGAMESLRKKNIQEVVDLITGKEDSIVRLQIRRSGVNEPFIVSLVRKKIDVGRSIVKFHSIPTADNKVLKIAHIKLSVFEYGKRRKRNKGYLDVKAGIKEVHEQGADGLIVDLRNNGGGGLSTGVGISNLFIKKGITLATHDYFGPPLTDDGLYSDELPEVVRYADEVDDLSAHYNGPMIVLVNGASASAAEIFSGILKDYGRALIVGTGTTFGKGSVQGIVNGNQRADKGSFLYGFFRINTAVFYTPSGHSPNVRGVKSDISIPSIYNTIESQEKRKVRLEKVKEYSIDPFLSADTETGAGTLWDRMRAEEISQLHLRSRDRVMNNEGFQKIKNEIKALDEYYKKSRSGEESVAEFAEELQRRKDLASSVNFTFLETRMHEMEAVNIMRDLIEIREQEKQRLNAEGSNNENKE